MTTKYERLKNLLLELFQLDKPDLDFGIYRIMHARSKEISGFLDRDLLPQVSEALNVYDQGNRTQLEADLNEARVKASELGIDPDKTPRVVELRAQLADASKAESIEGEVYDLIYRFFSRYYSEGDFISQRRYTSDSSYAIPYNGEEVTLHWANKDQYYIKTSEYLRDYAFRLNVHDDANPMRVHFKLVDATEGEHGNVKPTEGTARVFVLADGGASGHDFMAVEAGELTVCFEYRPATNADWPADQRAGQAKPPKQEKLAEFAVGAVLACSDPDLAPWVRALAAPRSGSSTSMIATHVGRYVARNTFDYFIHKDLGTFLRRELDFFIKNEVMRLDDIENESAAKVEQYLSKIKAVRKVAGKIIDFLAQLEDFQKKLWLKKKFVVGTSYLITLGNIDERFYDEICANDAQHNEWVQLLAIDKIEGDLVTAAYSSPLTASFLKSHPTLTLNTELFGSDFTSRLLESLDANGSLEEEMDGLLIHSDNFQALNLMAACFESRIKCVYIDPPYNTGQDGFIYKDSLKRSSWTSMMRSRLDAVAHLIADDGVVFASINEIERAALDWQLRDVFGQGNRIEELIWVRDTVSNNAPTYSTNHEYIEVFARDRAAVESNRSMFRETREGLSEVMELIGAMAQSYPAADTIRNALRLLFRDHKQAHLELSRARGESKDDAERSDPWKGIYPYRWAEYRDANGAYVDEADAARLKATIWVYREVEPSMPAGKQALSIKDPGSDNFRFYGAIHPATGRPCKPPKRGWAFPEKSVGDRPSLASYVADSRIVFKENDEAIPQLKYFLREVETVVSTSVVRHYADGEPQLEALFGAKGLIENPKPPGLIKRLVRQTVSGGEKVLDFFAGSGTTAHSVILMNRDDGARRRFIMVESGTHFDPVLVRRVRKVVFTPDWKDGAHKRFASAEEAERSPRTIKVLRLESYEDTLNNLDLRRDKQQQLLIKDPAAVALREEYTLRYMLDVESRGSQSLLNVAAFTDPTAYQLNVKSPGSDESRLVNADLLETFNYLIGLTVIQITAPRSFEAEFERDDEKRLQIASFRQAADGPHWFRTVTGTSPDGQRVLVIWRKRPGGEDPEGVEQDNTVLDHWFTNKQQYSVRDSEFDVIYVNGGNNLENMKRPDETWKVRLIEEDFHRLMFDTEGMP